jgi:subtilisin family serine protease
MKPKIKFRGCLIALILGFAIFGNGSFHARANEPKPSKSALQDRVVLRLTDPSAIQVFSERNGLTVIRTLRHTRGAYVVRAEDGRAAAKLADKLRKDKLVLLAETDSAATVIGADPFHSGAWGLPVLPAYHGQEAAEALNLSRAHALATGRGQIVAVIDTGVQLDHPALQDALIPGYDFVDDDELPFDRGDGIDNNADGRVDEVYGHGTHVAGIIRLVAPDAKILPLRVLDADGQGSILDLAEAISFATRNGATVINVSLGTRLNTLLLSDVIREATEKGVLIAASAGNLADDQAQFPAAEPCVVAVISTTAEDTLSEFSNYGKWVDFSAPGEAIFSTFPTNRYAHWSGTSMATPFVVGQMALLRSAKPELKTRTLVHVIDLSARDYRKDMRLNRRSGQMGLGRIDIGASLELLMSGQFDMSGKKRLKGGCNA